jgi:hypothetical protein
MGKKLDFRLGRDDSPPAELPPYHPGMEGFGKEMGK